MTLRRRHESDAALLRTLWTERDPRVPAHRRIDAKGRPTRTDLAARIRAERESDGPGLLTIVRKREADAIGYCGLVPSDVGGTDEPELAFELLSAVHGQGYATEAGEAVIARATARGYARLWATVWDWNVASRRVLEKLGFRELDRRGPVGPHGTTVVTVRDL
ncbi:Acetyltransferase, GNAT family [Actinomycetales bacterium JB111]|nr:Acetyltransferase, GNAT family [Actinomycetales bacterium JB111]